MKVKTVQMRYEDVLNLPKEKVFKPKKPSWLFRTLVKILSHGELKKCNFKVEKINMDKLGKKEPCLFLMNHSSFIDLKIASEILYPRVFNIVATEDSFVGKDWLLRQIGCVPTKKFINDPVLVKNIIYCAKTLKTSVLLYPEAGYSFDGTATTIPSSIGKFIKLLKIPVVMITSHGAFSRDPLYNNLQLRKVDISATLEYVLSPEEISKLNADEINDIIKKCFSFDNFKWQQDNKISITEPFRADYLHRVLYKCPHCMNEEKMRGEGIKLICDNCNTEYELDEFGYLKSKDNKFTHIPDWYKWQRECVKEEILNDKYGFDEEVDIIILRDHKQLYKIGSGRLTHNKKGFFLTGGEGKLNYKQDSISLYSLNSDFYWYEMGDVICIGDSTMLYYCIPKHKNIATKARLATEEIYKLISKK